MGFGPARAVEGAAVLRAAVAAASIEGGGILAAFAFGPFAPACIPLAFPADVLLAACFLGLPCFALAPDVAFLLFAALLLGTFVLPLAPVGFPAGVNEGRAGGVGIDARRAAVDGGWLHGHRIAARRVVGVGRDHGAARSQGAKGGGCSQPGKGVCHGGPHGKRGLGASAGHRRP